MTTSTRLRASLLPLAAAVLLTACSGAAPGSSAASPAPATPSPSVPASTDPNSSIGTDLPTSDPGAGGGDPGVGLPGAGRLVVPIPGQLDVHAISADKLSAILDGRRVIVTAVYTSGVEPCYILDSIVVERGDKSFAITLREGHGPGDVMCIEIAETKQTRIDLGELAPGTYTITDATGRAAPIQVVVR